MLTNSQIILGLAFARVAIQEWRDISPENRALAMDALDAAVMEIASQMAIPEMEMANV